MSSKHVQLSKSDRCEILSLSISNALRRKIERADKPIKVRSAKAKGMNFQATVCEFIADLIGIPFLRGDDESLILPRASGQNGTDIALRGEAKKRFPFSVECKASESLNIVETIAQAKANEGIGTDWLVVHRRKALEEDIVMMSWQTFAKFWSRTE